jgi:hypothetical protein
LLTVGNALGVQRAANGVVTNTRKILNPAAANKHNGVLLEVVADSRDIAGNFHPVGEANPANLTESGVRLLRGGGIYAGANAALLGARLQGRRSGTASLVVTAFFDQLTDSWHFNSLIIEPCIYSKAPFPASSA